MIASRRGASSSGCLLSLLVFVAALYYAVNIGEVYFRYYRLVDEMQPGEAGDEAGAVAGIERHQREVEGQRDAGDQP